MSARRVPVDPVMLLYAFRYALGRSTYVASDVASAIVEHARALEPGHRHVIRREIAAALAEDRAGHRVDADAWRRTERVLALLDATT